MAGRRARGSKPLKIIILSGGSGRTGERVVESALAQFDNANAEVVLKPRVRSRGAALKVIESMKTPGTVLCHTLVQPEVREAIVRECQLRDIQVVDLLGPTLSLLDDNLDGTPRNQPGLSYELNKEQFDRIEAVDFTLAHDDGARVRDLKHADVVLVGLSRVSKSVTCFYLAARGLRAANVPLTMIHPLPLELERIDSQRVIGLTMNASRLSAIRQTRLDRITTRPVDNYAEVREINAELRSAADIMRCHGWRSIDVSYRATEEVASEVIEMLPKRRKTRRAKSAAKSKPALRAVRKIKK